MGNANGISYLWLAGIEKNHGGCLMEKVLWRIGAFSSKCTRKLADSHSFKRSKLANQSDEIKNESWTWRNSDDSKSCRTH
jgi:hypothetical protein